MATQRGKTTPASTPGSFSPHAGSKSRVELDTGVAYTDIQREGREAAIAGGRYVPPAAVAAIRQYPIRDTDNWWHSLDVLREHNHHHGDYPMMPSRRSNGEPVKVSRYQTCRVDLRMPDVDHVRAYARSLGDNPTFDMPIEVETEHGPLATSVRCTPVGGGLWHVTVPGNRDTPARIAAAEAVRSTLEAQRPALALQDVTDLVAKARRRTPVGAFYTIRVEDSTVIEAVGVEPAGQAVTVQIAGRKYAYAMTPEQTAAFINKAAASGSWGRTYASELKGRHQRVVTHTCAGCSRTVVDPHICEQHRPRSH